jgi:hypothetical protein
MDDFIGSSPTPRSSTKELGLESDDIEPPSSPPDFKSIVAAYQPLDPSSSPPSSCVEKDVRVQQANERPEPPAEKMTDDKTAEIELPEYIPTVSEHAQVPALQKIASSRLRRTRFHASITILHQISASSSTLFQAPFLQVR